MVIEVVVTAQGVALAGLLIKAGAFLQRFKEMELKVDDLEKRDNHVEVAKIATKVDGIADALETLGSDFRSLQMFLMGKNFQTAAGK